MADRDSSSQKYKCTVAYDGTNYAGFQHQDNANTIQEAIEKALAKLHKHHVLIQASGRTDAGVHAWGQVFHFESSLGITNSNWTRAINARLQPDIRIMETVPVDPSFHARYDASSKEYRYFIRNHPLEDPFRRFYSYHVRQPLDMERMKEAAGMLVGEHDFTAFSSPKTKTSSNVRTIEQLEWIKDGEEWVLVCKGNGFLYNMVRIIVGTLIRTGRKKIDVKQIEQALQRRDRSLTGPTAPAHGLYLWEVTYSEV